MQGSEREKMKSRIFTPADILLPPYLPDDPSWTKWSVIACDQFTSEKEYWYKVSQTVSDMPSTLNFILPEAYLGQAEEEEQKKTVAESMKNAHSLLRSYKNSLIYIERTLSTGKVRRGLVGKIDLECYDFSRDSKSSVRATEATVLERIPPRCKIRSEADIELPHIMVFADDREKLISSLGERKAEMKCVYDFDLMMGGGHLVGYLISGELLCEVDEALSKYEASFTAPDSVIYAVGDGNHSLAAAKAHWENVKESGITNARYALCEIVDIGDSSIEFEPIYRILKNCDTADILEKLGELSGEGKQRICAVVGDREREFAFANPTHALTVGSLQNFIDGYIAAHPEVECDYIHGEDSLRALSRDSDSVGFLFDGMEKQELFPYVEKEGVLPRKTFSMGSADSKRYYTEARRIVD